MILCGIQNKRSSAFVSLGHVLNILGNFQPHVPIKTVLFAGSCILAQTVVLISFPCFFFYLFFLCIVVLSCLAWRFGIRSALFKKLLELRMPKRLISKTRLQYTGKKGKRRSKENI